MTKINLATEQSWPRDLFPPAVTGSKSGPSWEEIAPYFLGYEALDKLAEEDDSRGAYGGA